MPRRRELQSIANSLISLLSSRNNDYLGYCALGQLCSISAGTKNNVIAIDLNEPNSSSSSSVLQGISKNCSGYFFQQLQCRKIPKSWVKSAIFEVTFLESINEPKRWGKQVMCFQTQLTITSDLGAGFCASSNGNCVTHTPEKERRRSGF